IRSATRATRPAPFPYTTLFRSRAPGAGDSSGGAHHRAVAAALARGRVVEAGFLEPRPHDPRADRRAAPGVRRDQGHREDEARRRSEEHTSELHSLAYLVCRLLL